MDMVGRINIYNDRSNKEKTTSIKNILEAVLILSNLYLKFQNCKLLDICNKITSMKQRENLGATIYLKGGNKLNILIFN